MVKPNVGVLVYGDIGRSPRMQNHALQLARNFHVYLIGYKENAPFTEVTDHPDIEIVDISNDFLKKLKTIRIFYLYALLRVIIQTLQLLFLLLFRLKSMEFILVQNPPSIPVLSTVWIASIIRRFKMIVDFHNYGYTILKMNVKNRFIIAVAEKYEKMFSRKSAYSFCVSDNMRQNLQKEWGITAIPLYDRPSNKHLKVNAEAMLKKVGVQRKSDRDMVIVSSTSWTKDQDFGILLRALEKYQEEYEEGMPFLHVLITGKGPEKQAYQKLIAQMEQQGKITRFKVLTLWLEVDDYPKLLASCDMGVCLHYSSSGLDLPMKVVDMFNAELPVLAIDFATIGELVRDGVNGYIFKDSNDLCERLKSLAKGKQVELKQLRKNVRKEKQHTFERQWRQKFGPIIQNFLKNT